MKLKKTKTNSILLVISLLTILLIASCDKDDNGEPSDPKCLISSLNIAWYEVCDEETWSDNDTINLFYDSNDRLSKWEWFDGEYMLFIYNSNGKIETIEEHWGDEVYYLQFTWEGNKVTRHGYWGDEPSSSKIIIEFNNNDEIVRADSYYKYEDEWVLVRYNLYTWQNGNLVKIENYRRDDWKKSAEIECRVRTRKGIFSRKDLLDNKNVTKQKLKNTSNDFVLKYTSTFTHDNKHNPFSIHPALALWDFGNQLFHSKNNVTSWTEVETYNGEEHTWTETLTWEYNSYNYPKKLIFEEDEDDDCFGSETIEFNYNNCD